MSDSSSARTSQNVLSVIAEATQKQRAASDPMVSSWVSASAGSGKTKVLTDRILRLLLPREDGRPATRPEKILALTFTKAAANEMALRLSKRLSQWAVMEDEKLSGDLAALLGRDPAPEEIESARKLFARVVDTPGGLNIMTIHSFCQSVLGRFPVEAGLPPNFTPLDEPQAEELLNDAKKHVLSIASQDALSPIAESLRHISTLINEEQFAAIIRTFVGERRQIKEVLKRTFGMDGLYTNLCRTLGVPAGTTRESAILGFCTAPNEGDLREACAHLAQGKTNGDAERAMNIQSFWDEPLATRPTFYNKYKSAFLTGTGTIRAKLAAADIKKRAPHIDGILLYEAERLLGLENALKAILCADATRDLFRIGEAVLERYQYLKQSRGGLDFDDLILYTLSLFKGELESLEGKIVTPWILYKLDEGLDHILVDEAQDTNPEQWEIIRLLAGDFFDGEAARDDVRSIFVVGDEKQSIFSFQRADPKKFWEMFDWFEKKIKNSSKTFTPVPMNTSFRSVQILLDAVDEVFLSPEIVQGLTDKYLNHVAKRAGQGGLVELWPILRTSGTAGSDEDEKSGGWYVPDKFEESQSGSLKIANKIGDTIQKWIADKEILESYERPIQAGDIMVLVRSRNAFVSQLVRALKKRNIPVSGVDRMVLSDQLVVQDLLAASMFALQPDDDLSLASLLKSPFIGFSEEQLYKVSYGRSSNLWDALKQNGDSDTIEWLQSLIARAGADHPYEFFSHLIQEACPANKASGLKAIRARLGEDALDPLDEFLNTTLSYENLHHAGLQGFLKWQESSHSEIKRQLDEGGGAVRIMTVHGAKGLQAPIVFLPDTVRVSSGNKRETILWPQKTGLDVPLYVPSKEKMPESLQAAQNVIDQKADEEYRRLLYVAMTRAEERLYIGGYTGKKQPGEDAKMAYWYNDIRKAFETRKDISQIKSGVVDEEGNDIPTMRLFSKRTAPPDKIDASKSLSAEKPVRLDDWMGESAPAESFPPRPLVPSRPTESEPATNSPREASQAFRFKRGNITHKLMQILPDLPLEKRRSAAEKFLARPSLDLPSDLQKDIASEVMAILEDATFAEIFGPQSMAEIPVTGLVNGRLISGQIDRVLVREKDILIVDYKTNRPPPQKVEDVSKVYIAQMKAYADTLQAIYPSHKIRCALLWTDGCRLMELV